LILREDINAISDMASKPFNKISIMIAKISKYILLISYPYFFILIKYFILN